MPFTEPHPGMPSGSVNPNDPSGQSGSNPGATQTAESSTTSSLMMSGNGHPAIGSDGSTAGSLPQEETSLQLAGALARMPVNLTVAIPVRNFRVRNLLAMVSGLVVETQWGHGEDLPLASGEVQLAWAEFEVVDTRLAVRVTRLG
jgi:flagellar motor switch protein FliN/FliY